MKKVRVHYDQLKVINAAKYLSKYNNCGVFNKDKSVEDWYREILGNIKRSAEENLDMFSTSGYTLNFDIDSFDSYHVDITVSSSFGDSIHETMEVDIL